MNVRLDDRRLRRIPKALEKAADNLCEATAKQVEVRMKTAIQHGDKTGRVYQVSPGIYHRASAPGEAPATETGNLVNSIDVEQMASMHHQVNVHARYGVHLEYGTVRMAPRPFLRSAFEEQREHWQRGVAALIAQARSDVV